MRSALLALLLAAAPVLAQAPAKPTWAYAHDLLVRKGGSADFGKETPKVGVEFFRDDSTGAVVAVSQTGSLAVTPAGKPSADTKAAWLFAHDLRARKGDEDKFTATTAKFGVEVFRDAGTGQLLYVSEAASIAFAPAPAEMSADKGTTWHHALTLKVRGPDEKTFGSGTKKFGVEAFKDNNTNGLLYVTETAAIAYAPAPGSPPTAEKVRAPQALYGLTLRVRKAGEANFGPTTKSVGVEVFLDPNSNNLLYISETGSIAAAPAPAERESGKGVTWKSAMELSARAGGVSEFASATKYGVEVFRDNNAGHLVFVSDAGAIAVLAAKK